MLEIKIFLTAKNSFYKVTIYWLIYDLKSIEIYHPDNILMYLSFRF